MTENKFAETKFACHAPVARINAQLKSTNWQNTLILAIGIILITVRYTVIPKLERISVDHTIHIIGIHLFLSRYVSHSTGSFIDYTDHSTKSSCDRYANFVPTKKIWTPSYPVRP